MLTIIGRILLVVFLNSVNGDISKCPDYQVHFEKILGYRPPLNGPLKTLYQSADCVPSVINLQCMEVCRNDRNCESYVLNFNQSACYGFTSNDRQLATHNLRQLDDNELVEDINVVYFVKSCLSSEYHTHTIRFPHELAINLNATQSSGRPSLTKRQFL